MKLYLALLGTLTKHATSERLLIASAQLFGLLSFYIVIDGASAQTVKLMSLYISSQAASAFISLAIQFSEKRESVLSLRFMGFLFIYFGFIFTIFKGNTGASLDYELITVAVFLIMIVIQLTVTALNKYKLLLMLQLLFALILPFVVVHPVIIFSIMIILLLFVSIKLDLTLVFRNSVFSFGDIKNWLYSLCMQAPFILYPFFDPFLSSRLNIEVYGQYLIYGKIIFGVTNFFFSFFQFKLIRGEHLEVEKLPHLVFLITTISLCLSQTYIPLYVYVFFLDLVVNVGSLYIRSSLKKCRVHHLFASILCIVAYLCGLQYFSNDFFQAENNYFLPFLMFCISCPVLLVWFSVSFRTPFSARRK